MFINKFFVISTMLYNVHYKYTSGFWPRVRARKLRAPVFLGSLTRKTGALRAPVHRSFAASHLPPKTFPQARTRAARGVLYIFPLG